MAWIQLLQKKLVTKDFTNRLSKRLCYVGRRCKALQAMQFKVWGVFWEASTISRGLARAHGIQPVVMKPCFDAGLVELAKVAGYPVAAVKSCGQFKSTHFLVEALEAVYKSTLCTFFSSNRSDKDLLHCIIDSRQLNAATRTLNQISNIHKTYQIKGYPIEMFWAWMAHWNDMRKLCHFSRCHGILSCHQKLKVNGNNWAYGAHFLNIWPQHILKYITAPYILGMFD